VSTEIETDTHRETRKEDKVGFWEKLAFGVGTLPVFYAIAGVNSFAIPVYQMTLKLDPVLVGAALAIPRFLDAFLDPVMGRISDNTRSRWGRRRPYIFCGAILQAVLFGMIWMVPSTWSHSAMAAYLIGTLMMFYIGYSIYSVPLNSLGYEMTPDYRERTNVWAFATFFNKVGELSYGWIFPLTALFASVMQGVQVIGWVIGLVVVGGMGILPSLFVKERYFKKAEKQEKVHIWPALKASASNRAFMLLVGLMVLQIGAGMLASNLDFYLIVYYMFGGDVPQGAVWKAWLSTGYAVLGLVWIFPITWLSNRYGKHVTLGITFGLVLLGAAGKWFLFTPGHPWKILLDPVLCGPVWVAIYALTRSMLADICDEDELRHGFRREGVFGAVFSWVEKTGFSFGFLGAMLILKLTGFNAANASGIQTPDTILSMRLVLTVSTAAWAILALIILYYYPLNRKRAYEIRDALEARRGKV
jgi:GPH family glycoside/pentoside/hexuronide:cation symporter